MEGESKVMVTESKKRDDEEKTKKDGFGLWVYFKRLTFEVAASALRHFHLILISHLFSNLARAPLPSDAPYFNQCRKKAISQIHSHKEKIGEFRCAMGDGLPTEGKQIRPFQRCRAGREANSSETSEWRGWVIDYFCNNTRERSVI